jgi:hypothetical protein
MLSVYVLIMPGENHNLLNYNRNGFRMSSSNGEGKRRSALEPGISNPYLHDAVH